MAPYPNWQWKQAQTLYSEGSNPSGANMDINNIEEIQKVFEELNIKIFRIKKRDGRIFYCGTGEFEEDLVKNRFGDIEIEYKRGFFPHVIFKF